MIVKDFLYNENEFGMNYKVFCPENYKDLPLLVYLHGAGERGKNIENLYRHGIPKLLNEGKEIAAVVLCPQCPEQYVWDNVVEKIKKIIDRVAEEFEIKKDRICITGSSMGGFGTWMMAKTYPSFFSAAAPVAGGGMSWRTPKLVTTPILAIHGTEDVTVPPIYSELMVNAVKDSGGNVEYIELEGYSHNDGIDYAYRNTKLIDWILEKRRENFEYVPEICESMF